MQRVEFARLLYTALSDKTMDGTDRESLDLLRAEVEQAALVEPTGEGSVIMLEMRDGASVEIVVRRYPA